MREIIQDRYGNSIYLTEERWKHIVKYHPQLISYRDEVLRTVRSGKRRQDLLWPDKFYYYRRPAKSLGGRFTSIEVVVLFRWRNGHPNNFVVTAYPV